MSLVSVSVVIPTFNRADYLPLAVESALGQTAVNVEVIIVDDGSTDDTAGVVAGMAPRWGERVHYVWQMNAERSVARNHGLRLANGEFVSFLDSDDVWLPHHATTCLAALVNQPEAVASYGEYGLIDAYGGVIRDMVPRPPTSGRRFLRDLCLKRLILHPSRIVLRRAAVTTPELFDEQIPGAEDWLCWIKLARLGSFLPTGERTVWMRVHPKGTFGEPHKFGRSLMAAARKVVDLGLPGELGIPAGRIMSINRIHCAYAHYLSGEWPEAMRLLGQSVRGYPPALLESDFWKVTARLCLGRRLSKRIRTARQRGRHSAAETVPES